MEFVAKTLFGLEPVLAGELADLGATDIEKVNRAVTFRGDKALLYRINYCCRTALSVLVNIASFRIRTKDDLYRKGSAINWTNYLDVGDTFSVSPVINSSLFSHTGYPALILKDAIADHFRKISGKRPSVDNSDPGLLINLHISNESVSVSLDSSGIPLFKRGYRSGQAVAPLNEVLAAGMLKLAGWDETVPLLDPMCGSGTIPIEAGLMASNIPPGKFRQFFGFQRWKDYDDDLFRNIKREEDEKITWPGTVISGSDISGTAVQQARINADRAGLNGKVTFEEADFTRLSSSGENMIIFLNPPYGERLKPDNTDTLYTAIGATLKHKFPGSTAWLITSNKESLKYVGLKPARKFTLYNGALECLLLKYVMYPGSLKT